MANPTHSYPGSRCPWSSGEPAFLDRVDAPLWKSELPPLKRQMLNDEFECSRDESLAGSYSRSPGNRIDAFSCSACVSSRWRHRSRTGTSERPHGLVVIAVGQQAIDLGKDRRGRIAFLQQVLEVVGRGLVRHRSLRRIESNEASQLWHLVLSLFNRRVRRVESKSRATDAQYRSSPAGGCPYALVALGATVRLLPPESVSSSVFNPVAV